MNKLFVLLFACAFLSACGGESPEDKAKKYCDCVEDVLKGERPVDPAKANECEMIYREGRISLGTDDPAIETYRDGVRDCKDKMEEATR